VSSQKTEQPSPKKLKDSRRKGDVAYSREFSQTALMLALLAYLALNAENLLQACARLLLLPVDLTHLEFRTALQVALREGVQRLLILLAPFIAIVLGVGLLAEFGQIGFLMVFDKLKISGAKLNIVTNAKNIVSVRNLVETLKALIKIVCFTAVLVPLLKDSFAPLAYAPHAGLGSVMRVTGSLLQDLFLYCGLLCVLLALFDLGWQRRQRRRRLMMTIEEVKREYKETEGQPEVKRQRKRLHRELANGSMAAVRKASVLVVNPTHIAVALFYQPEDTPMPVVLAKGSDAEALDMIDVAQEAGVPVMRNIPLARALMSSAELNEYIPGELAAPVAEVLRLIQRLAAAVNRDGSAFEPLDR
jgi:type III secretion protein U